MPLIAEAALEPICGKKRRRADAEDGDVQLLKASGQLPIYQAPLSSMPYPFNGQNRTEIPALGLREGHARRQITPRSLRGHLEPSKRQRVEHRPAPVPSLPEDAAADGHAAHEPEPRSRAHGKPDLSPCHICHRRPTARRELDAFADCEGCGRRTCWVCIRECPGFGLLAVGLRPAGGARSGFLCGFGEMEHGAGALGDGEEMGVVVDHRGMVCSRCCVERGSNGDVWCLGCLKVEGEV